MSQRGVAPSGPGLDDPAISIDTLPALLTSAGILPIESILDCTFSVSDVSRRNRNHRATWGEAKGVLVKQPGPVAAGAEHTLRNEIEFYAACARLMGGRTLPLVEVLSATSTPPLLVLQLSRTAKSLLEWRDAGADPRAAYIALGHGLGSLHALSASAPFLADQYAQSLPPARVPYALSLHQPNPFFLRTASGAHLQMLRIIQQETNLGEHFERLAARLRPTHVIHGDMKADNVLVESDESILIIDWELAQRGDPAVDVGAVLADTLGHFLRVLAPKQGTDAAAIVENAAEPTLFAHRACVAFWTGYRSGARLSAATAEELLSRAVLCSAADLARYAFDHGQGHAAMTNHSVAALQVAVNLFAEPAEGAEVLFGLKPSKSA